MIHLVVIMGLIVGEPQGLNSPCIDCSQEHAEVVQAEQFYNQMQAAEQAAAEAFYADPTAETLSAWLEAQDILNVALQNLYDAQAAYDNCLNGNDDPEEILAATVSILE